LNFAALWGSVIRRAEGYAESIEFTAALTLAFYRASATLSLL